MTSNKSVALLRCLVPLLAPAAHCRLSCNIQTNSSLRLREARPCALVASRSFHIWRNMSEEGARRQDLVEWRKMDGVYTPSCGRRPFPKARYGRVVRGGGRAVYIHHGGRGRLVASLRWVARCQMGMYNVQKPSSVRRTGGLQRKRPDVKTSDRFLVLSGAGQETLLITARRKKSSDHGAPLRVGGASVRRG